MFLSPFGASGHSNSSGGFQKSTSTGYYAKPHTEQKPSTTSSGPKGNYFNPRTGDNNNNNNNNKVLIHSLSILAAIAIITEQQTVIEGGIKLIAGARRRSMCTERL